MSAIGIFWIAASFLIALMGMNTRFGFWGMFFGSLLLSPIIGFILLLAMSKNYRRIKIIEPCKQSIERKEHD